MTAAERDYKVQIVDASFKLCIQRPNPALTMAHVKMLEKSPAIYPYLFSNKKKQNLSQGENSLLRSTTYFKEKSPPTSFQDWYQAAHSVESIRNHHLTFSPLIVNSWLSMQTDSRFRPNPFSLTTSLILTWKLTKPLSCVCRTRRISERKCIERL